MNSGGVLWSWASGIFDPCRFHAWLFVNKVVCTCNARCNLLPLVANVAKRITYCADEENFIWECFYSDKTCVKGHRFSEVPHLRNPPIAFVYRFMWRQYASLACSHNRDARGHGITWRANANVLLRPQYTLVVRVTPDPVTRITWQASRESRLTSVLCVYIDEDEGRRQIW